MEKRVLDEGDAEALWALRLRGLASDPEAFGSTYDEALEAGDEVYRQRLREVSDRAFYLGAWDGAELAGMVRFTREEGAKDQHKGEVSSLYVAPQRRGQGIGRALMAELIARAGQMPGLEQLHLSVVTTNVAAAVLYRSLGFAIYGTVLHALKDGDRYWDEDMMGLFLIGNSVAVGVHSPWPRRFSPAGRRSRLLALCIRRASLSLSHQRLELLRV